MKRVVVDSISQCLLRGEAFQAMKAGVFHKQDMIELGHVIQQARAIPKGYRICLSQREGRHRPWNTYGRASG